MYQYYYEEGGILTYFEIENIFLFYYFLIFPLLYHALILTLGKKLSQVSSSRSELEVETSAKTSWKMQTQKLKRALYKVDN